MLTRRTFMQLMGGATAAAVTGPRSDVLLPQSGTPTGAGMVGLGRELRRNQQ